MSRVRVFAIGVIVAICLCAPMLETVDRWDHTLQDGNDTEMSLVVVALCVGVALSVAGAIVACVRSQVRTQSGFVFIPASLVLSQRTFGVPIPNSSPPTALRI